MTHLRTTLLALLVLGAISVASASAATAHEFTASEESKLVGTATQTQIFTTAAGNAECKTVEIESGTSIKGKTSSILVILILRNCKAFGLVATVSPAYYLVHASGTVRIEKPITVKATGCEVRIPEQEDGTVAFSNPKSKKELVLTPSVTGITSEGTGSACAYVKESKGTHTGTSLVTLAGGGELTWE